MPEQLNITNLPSSRVEFIDPRTGLMSREWYRFFLNIFTLVGGGNNQTSLDDLQLAPPFVPATAGGGSGTVTSVDVSGGTTGLTTSGGPITTSGTITLAGILNIANGGTGATTASGARANLSAAVLGTNNDITSMTGVTGGISSPDFIQFDTTATVTDATGKLYYDNADQFQTLTFQMNGGTIQRIGEELYYRVKLSASATKGQVLMFTGTLGASGGLQAAPATGLQPEQASYILGVAHESGATNDWVSVTSFGEVKEIDTTGGAETWVQGDVLYYDPLVTGGLTKFKPTTPAAICLVAAVVNVGVSNGILFVRPTYGSVLGGTDGNVNFTTLASGNTLIYDAVAGVWENANLTDGTGISITEGPGSITIANTGVTSAIAGTGISVSSATGDVTFTNTAPDQTVSLTGGTGISTSGTYPNFTITNTLPDQVVSLTGGTGISTSGTYPSFTITNTLPDQVVSLTGAGTTSISGTYPNFTITSNDQYVGTVTSVSGTGTVNGISLSGTVTSSGSLTLGGTLTGVDLTSQVTGTLPIANGGTGQTTASAAFNALSPITSTGDLIIGNGANSATRLAIGANNYVLTSNGTTAVWAVATGSGATITNDTTTATNVYPTFAAATSGSLATVYTSDAKLLYKPSTGEFLSQQFNAGNGIYVNSKTVSTSYTIATGNSGMSAGPITIASGRTVTISSGSRWVVL